MKIKFKCNDSIHPCSICIHRKGGKGCKQTYESLLEHGIRYGDVISHPQNCPAILNKGKVIKEKVIFT